MAAQTPYLADCSTIDDPDCLHCLRTKLEAIGVVVFFRNADGSWRLGGYQSAKPSEAAEAECHHMLQTGLPEKILAGERVVILSNHRDIKLNFPHLAPSFGGSSLIAARVQRDELVGVRIAWRDEKAPFTAEDEATIHCWGNCPEGCCDHCAVGGG